MPQCSMTRQVAQRHHQCVIYSECIIGLCRWVSRCFDFGMIKKVVKGPGTAGLGGGGAEVGAYVGAGG